MSKWKFFFSLFFFCLGMVESWMMFLFCFIFFIKGSLLFKFFGHQEKNIKQNEMMNEY